MCLGSTGQISYPQPMTYAQMQKDTDNPRVNPISGEETPHWKLDKNKKTNKDELKTSMPSEKYG
tara:strand:+ start:369 stop:560 length:192 start_codon:yes stop_codon:yes gene_type:complete